MIGKSKYKIGIIGIGYVGGALKNWFEKEKYPLFLYDKYKKIGSVEEVNSADIIFVCVPTPFEKDGGGYDESAILESFKLFQESKTIVIKSTILPGSTEKFQEKFPQHKVLFNPEFLKAKTAKEDFINPERQIIGFTEKSKDVAQKVISILPEAHYSKIIPSKEAEIVKYFSNAFLSSKVIFANQIYDLCQALDIDYEIVKEVASHDSRIGGSHLDVFYDGYRGYAGACFLKDVKSIVQLANSLGVDFRLLETVDNINEGIIKSNHDTK